MATTEEKIIDERLAQVEDDKKSAVEENQKVYDDMIGKVDSYYNDQAAALDEVQKLETDIQNAKTDFTVNEIERQKEQAVKDYEKEQSGAYTDYKKQTQKHGVNAEKTANAGLSKSGYSESADVAMYNQYQSRVTAARESISLAMRDYESAITQARLQNSTSLAEIAASTLQKKLALAIEGFQYQNSLIIEKSDKQTALDEMYHKRYLDVLAQINAEKATEYPYLFDSDGETEESTDDAPLFPFFNKTEEKGNSSSTPSAETNKSSNWWKDLLKQMKSANTSDTKTEPEEKKLTVNKQSIVDLGYGMISANELDKLIKEGKVVEYEKDGQLYYFRSDIRK